MSDDKKFWLVTGVSRGLGQEIARAALSRGDTVVGTSRSGEADLDHGAGELHTLALDLADPEAPARVVAQALELTGGRLDVLVNNAGYGLMGAIEATDEQELADVFAANLFGPIRLIQAALPTFRGGRGGTIINVSSIAALAPLQGSGLYASAKAALGAASESLAQELAPFGVRVTVVEPGAFRTDFLASRSVRMTRRVLDDYERSANAGVASVMTMAGEQTGDPAQAARAIVGLVDAGDPPMHLVLGSDALRRTRAVVRRWHEELDGWEDTSRGTDFAAGPGALRP